jgi:hypothetical protein
MHCQEDLLYILAQAVTLILGLSPKRKGEEEGLSDNPKKWEPFTWEKNVPNLHRVQPMRMVVLNFGCAILM